MDNLTWSIAGTAYKSLAEGFYTGGNAGQTIAAGIYYAHGDIAPAPMESAPMYKELEVDFPGVDGVAIKRMGFRGRFIRGTLAFVYPTKAQVEAAKHSFFTTITALASFRVIIPGAGYRDNCRMVPGSGNPKSWLCLAGMHVLLVEVEFRQLRN